MSSIVLNFNASPAIQSTDAVFLAQKQNDAQQELASDIQNAVGVSGGIELSKGDEVAENVRNGKYTGSQEGDEDLLLELSNSNGGIYSIFYQFYFYDQSQDQNIIS
jgi:hypothetical protein